MLAPPRMKSQHNGQRLIIYSTNAWRHPALGRRKQDLDVSEGLTRAVFTLARAKAGHMTAGTHTRSVQDRLEGERCSRPLAFELGTGPSTLFRRFKKSNTYNPFGTRTLSRKRSGASMVSFNGRIRARIEHVFAAQIMLRAQPRSPLQKVAYNITPAASKGCCMKMAGMHTASQSTRRSLMVSYLNCGMLLR